MGQRDEFAASSWLVRQVASPIHNLNGQGLVVSFLER
jgi:hypothetical protein